MKAISGITAVLLLGHWLPPLPPPTVPAACQLLFSPLPCLPAGHVSYTTLRKQALVTELQVRGGHSQARALHALPLPFCPTAA